MFKINGDKTKFIVYNYKLNVKSFADHNVQAGSTKVEISSNNIRVAFDYTLSMQAHVNTIAKKCFITRIHLTLSVEKCKLISTFL